MELSPLVRATSTCCYRTRRLCHKYMNTFYEQVLTVSSKLAWHAALYSKTHLSSWFKKLLKHWLEDALTKDNYILNNWCVRGSQMHFPKISNESSWGWKKGVSSQEPTVGSDCKTKRPAFYCFLISIQENSMEVKEVWICLCSKQYISWYQLHS